MLIVSVPLKKYYFSHSLVQYLLYYLNLMFSLFGSKLGTSNILLVSYLLL